MTTSARIRLHLLGAAVVVAVGGGRAVVAAPSLPRIEVHKSPSCSCCTGWVDHVRQAGFDVTVHETEAVDALKDQLQVPERLRSCHTAQVAGYFLEGHVPAADIRRLVAQRPRARGLAVPGMPIGSPGMEVPGRAPQKFDVLLVAADGTPTVFATHNQAANQAGGR